MSIVLFVLFLAFNFFALRTLLRWLREVLVALRDDPEREGAIEEYGRGESMRKATDGLFGGVHLSNPMERVAIMAGLIGSLLVADYHTIRKLWPGLLPAALTAPAQRTR